MQKGVSWKGIEDQMGPKCGTNARTWSEAVGEGNGMGTSPHVGKGQNTMILSGFAKLWQLMKS